MVPSSIVHIQLKQNKVKSHFLKVLTKEEIPIENNQGLPKLGDLDFDPIGVKVKYFCEFCRGKFESEIVLLQHISSKHEENRFNICTVCWKCFGEKSTLKKHVSAIHENKRPHICQTCSSRQVQNIFLKVIILESAFQYLK